MQTTLLGIGIAIILALLTALVGPFLINWSDYRGIFEARASKAIGMPVRIAGRIDARALPVPSVTLRAVEIQGPSGEVRLKARELGIELALGSLLRGEWRATELRLSGAQADLGLDAAGRLNWTPGTAGGDADAISIERLQVEDSRLTFSDAASGSRVTLENLWFNGEVRSLAGPVKGEGGFLRAGERNAFRLTTGRLGDDGLRVRLAVDPADRPMTAEADGGLRFEGGSPRFEGALTLARLPTVALSRGRAVSTEPWRLTGRIKVTPAATLFEQLDITYGAEERATKLTGAAELKFGPRPRLEAVVSARQLDLDRMVTLPDGAQKVPLVVLRTAAETLGFGPQPDFPVRIGLGVNSATIAGGTVQTLRGDFVSDSNGWNVEALEFRAPGLAQVRASGRVALSAQGASFNGPASLEAGDPKTFFAWLEGRTGGTAGQMGALRASGDVTLGYERVAIERLNAEIDRKAIAGRFSYAWPTAGQRPRLDAELKAAELDLDAAADWLRAAVPDANLDTPTEVRLALDLGRARLAGIDARDARVTLKLDSDGLVFERLTVGDLAGAAIELSGRLEGPWSAPHGALTFDVAGQRLDGVAALLAAAAPEAADVLRAAAPQLGPAKLRVTLAVERADRSKPGQATTARAQVEGVAGAFQVTMRGSLAGDTATWSSAALELEGSARADDGRAFVRLLKLENALTAGTGAGTWQFGASGPLGGPVRIQGRLAATGLDATANGAVTVGREGVAGTVDLSANAADVVLLRQPLGRAGQPAPVTLKTQLVFGHNSVSFEKLTATAAATTVNGALRLAFENPPRLDGRLEADVIDASALVAALLGMPPAATGRTANAVVWTADPFGNRFLENLSGRIELQASRAALTPALDIRQFKGLLRLGASEAAIDDITGVLAGGRLSAGLVMPRGPEGAGLEARIGLTGADIAGLAPGSVRSPVSGRVSVQVEVKGRGRSAATMVGAFGGAGTISLEDMELVGLDPSVFDAVTRATDQGVPVDGPRIAGLVESALGHGRLRVARADGTLVVTAGQIRLGGLLAKGDHADLVASASVDLAQLLLDARLALIGRSGPNDPAAGRPELFVAFKGPLAAPKRSIDASAMVGWLTLRSVDLQARKLEALEAERRVQDAARAAEGARRPVVRAETTVAPPPSTPEPAAVPASAPAQPAFPPIMAPEATPLRRAPPALPAAPVESAPLVTAPGPLPRLRRVTPSFGLPPAAPEAGTAKAADPPPQSLAAPSEQVAPALPPPIDIRPAPSPRRGTALPPAVQRPDASADTRLPPPATVAPARPRNLLDLFGAAR